RQPLYFRGNDGYPPLGAAGVLSGLAAELFARGAQGREPAWHSAHDRRPARARRSGPRARCAAWAACVREELKPLQHSIAGWPHDYGQPGGVLSTNSALPLRVFRRAAAACSAILMYDMPIADLQEAAQKIAGFLNTLNKLGGMRLKFRITAGDGARDPEGLEGRQIYVELGGSDVPMVTAHNGELLRALETVAAQMLRLEPREHDLVSFDAGNFKALRAQELRMAAETAADKVRRTGMPYSFPPMNSRERRLL